MRRPAERRAQATVEWLAVIVAVGAALAAGSLATSEVARHVAERLAPSPADELGPQLLAAAVRGDRNALSLQGAAGVTLHKSAVNHALVPKTFLAD